MITFDESDQNDNSNKHTSVEERVQDRGTSWCPEVYGPDRSAAQVNIRSRQTLPRQTRCDVRDGNSCRSADAFRSRELGAADVHRRDAAYRDNGPEYPPAGAPQRLQQYRQRQYRGIRPQGHVAQAGNPPAPRAWVYRSPKFSVSPIRVSPARYRFPVPIPRTWKSRPNSTTACRRSLARRIRTSH